MSRLDFANYDFDSVVAQLRSIVQANDAWKDIDITAGTGNFLIELFSYVSEMVMYYLERRAQESYIDTAQLRSSVARLVALINYKPKRATSATGTLMFSLGSWHNGDIYLTRGTTVIDADGTKYIVFKDVVLRTGLTSAAAQGIQGQLVQVSSVSTGIQNMEIGIDDTAVENSTDLSNPTMKVTVDGSLWTMVSSFVDSNSDSKHFTQTTKLDGTVIITFGDGKFGAIPTNGVDIVIEYIRTSGSDGNVLSTGMITAFDPTTAILDEHGVDVTDLLSVTNTTTFLGGDDEEDINEIRDEAPRVFKTGDRAVTRGDFIAVIDNIPGIKTSYVWGERDEMPAYWQHSHSYVAGNQVTDQDDNSVWECVAPNTSASSGTFAADRAGAAAGCWNSVLTPANITYFNKIRVVALYDQWVNPDSAQRATIATALQQKEQLTVWLEFVDADMIDTIADVEVKVLSAYQTSQILSNVSAMLDSLFTLGTVKLGTDIRSSDVIAAIEGVTGVDYCHLTFRHKESMGMGGSGPITHFSLTTSQLTPMKAETVSIYVNNTLIGTDNGSGVISAPGVLSAGVVTYATGYVSVDFVLGSAPSPTDEVFVIYQQDEGGDIVVGKDQIVKLTDKNVTQIN